jgi:hypothetical protein
MASMLDRICREENRGMSEDKGPGAPFLRNLGTPGQAFPWTVEGNPMPWLIISVLSLLWILGLLTSTSLWGLVHVLPVFAILILLRRVLHGPAIVIQNRGDGIHRPFKRS